MGENFYTIALYGGPLDDNGNMGNYADANYCGTFSLLCLDGDPAVERLAAVNCGRFTDEDDKPQRGFFFEDELDVILEYAENRTGCKAFANLVEAPDV